MKVSEARMLVAKAGGIETAISIVYDGPEPKENRFKWWDVKALDFSLIHTNQFCIYTPELQNALKKLNYV